MITYGYPSPAVEFYDDLLFNDLSILYEELYPKISDEEFNFLQMEIEHHLDEMIREHEEDDFIQHLINSEAVL